jgi:hypothetical protein
LARVERVLHEKPFDSEADAFREMAGIREAFVIWRVDTTVPKTDGPSVTLTAKTPGREEWTFVIGYDAFTRAAV